MTKMAEKFFTIKTLGDDIFSVSSSPAFAGGAKDRFIPILQSYVIVGRSKCVVIDSPQPQEADFCGFVRGSFGMPIIVANTHGHIDHIGCNAQFDSVYLSPLDFDLVRGGGIMRDPKGELPYRILPLLDGDEIELGNRTLRVIALPGHTMGSIGFWDTASKTLFSGDAIARRVLYGLSDEVPLSHYFDALRSASDLAPKRIFSAHDAFALSGRWNETIIKTLRAELFTTRREWFSPIDGKRFLRILIGEEKDENFFDFTIAEELVGRENI